MSEFVDRVTGIGALAEPVRRELYLYVCAQPGAVGREEAADAIGIPQHKAKFHLDRLESDGLLETEYARLTGRSGPGAGRPAKLYRRSSQEIAVSLPDREYELAGLLMADAIAESTRTGEPVLDAVSRVAAERGRAIGDRIVADLGSPRGLKRAKEVACRALTDHGYEPREDGGQVVLANCPFHALVKDHTELVCSMNVALIDGMVGALDEPRLCARLEPAEGRCCVVLATQGPA